MSEKQNIKKLPELLCPAGSPEALDAAIDGGADAVYLGGTSFNARINAKNFGGDALRSAVLRAHAFGVKVYLTLNTLITDREFPAMLDAVREAVAAGVDALIVADLGVAAAIKRTFPSLELHASTQMSGHSARMGTELQKMGFRRMVIARETSAEDIRTIVAQSPIEVEMFIHGALCVSHSGQCLFSSLVGGRSGNRGECAQPCRLPYSCAGCQSKESYPLSLKDLSLAAHVPELIDAGVASLKIEGRMKSPEYVRDTARIWRRLLDERRAATVEELRELESIFSRSGFTDAYFQRQIDSRMLGIRSEQNKTASRTLETFQGLTRQIPLEVTARMQTDQPISMTLSNGTKQVTVMGEPPLAAINAPLTKEALERSLTKFGGTPFLAAKFEAELDEGLMLPVSKLNELRRRALSAWQEETSAEETFKELPYVPKTPLKDRATVRSAYFYSPKQITEKARVFFDRRFLPLHLYTKEANGVALPPVIFDSEEAEVKPQLSNAAKQGATYALIGNLAHLALVQEVGLIPTGDYRLNLTNRESIAQIETYGFESMILSPELTLPQIRDVGGNTSAIVYGRIPLMTLEKCVIKDLADCDRCAKGNVSLRDRKGVTFPILREWKHRNIICNSRPTGMSDREDQLAQAKITSRHFIFTVESAQQIDHVIDAYTRHTTLKEAVRRI